MRNSCQKEGDAKIKCYRGLNYQISPAIKASSYIEHQKSLLDEEIEIAKLKLKQVRELRAKEKELELITQQGEITADPKNKVSEKPRWMLGMDILGATSRVFIHEGLSATFGLNLIYLVNRRFGLQAGVGFDVWQTDQIDPLFLYEDQTTHAGVSAFVGVPIYFKVTGDLNGEGAFFITPELRRFQHGTSDRTGLGFSAGWQDLVSPGQGGFGIRAGALNLVDFSETPGSLFFLSATFLLGI